MLCLVFVYYSIACSTRVVSVTVFRLHSQGGGQGYTLYGCQITQWTTSDQTIYSFENT
jgi:hypothetical protein